MSLRAASRASVGKSTVVTATAKMPCGSMYRRNALSIAAGASSGSSSREANSVSTRKFTFTRPIVSVTGSIRTSTRFTAGIAPVDDHRQPAVEPAQPRDRQEELHERPEDDDSRVEVELRALVVDLRDAEEEPDDDHGVPGDRRERRQREVVVRVEDPDDDPGEAEQDDDREEDARETDRELVVAAGIPERAHEERREQDEDRGDAAEDEQRQPEERRGDAPGALPLALLEQLAEDRDERAGERGVGDERAHEVRDLDRDRERVDEPGDAEEVGADHLADEAEHPRDRRLRARRRRWNARSGGCCGRGQEGVDVGVGSMARCDSPSGVCYHRAARGRGHFLEWRTSSNRRSAS